MPFMLNVVAAAVVGNSLGLKVQGSWLCICMMHDCNRVLTLVTGRC